MIFLSLFLIDKKQQNYTQLMKPQSTKIQNNHALKKSVISDSGSFSHLNPSSTKAKVKQRNSLNSSINQSQSDDTKNVNYIKFQNYPHTPNQRITLNPENFQNPASQIERKVHEIEIKIDRIEIQLERNWKKMNLLEKRGQESQNIKQIRKIVQEQFSEIRQKGEQQTKNFSRELENLRKGIEETVAKKDIEQQIHHIKKDIKGNFQLLEIQIDEIVKNYQINKEKQTRKVAKIIEEKFKTLENQLSSEKFNHQIWEKNTNSSQFTYSQKIFLGNPILLKFQNIFSIFSNKKSIEIERIEAIYRIDLEGYLLDEENRYLVDENGKQIQLSTQQLSMLREKGVLK